MDSLESSGSSLPNTNHSSTSFHRMAKFACLTVDLNTKTAEPVAMLTPDQ